MQDRALNPAQAFVRISVDGGGGFLKVIANVFDSDCLHSTSDKFQDSGVQRSQFIAIVEDVPESNHNLRLIMEKLMLERVTFSLAFDLKCGNAVFGLSSHAGKYACLWCEGKSEILPGKPRTLGSLDEQLSSFIESGSQLNRMMDFKNVINKRLIYLEEDPETSLEHIAPPPELHLLMGVVDKLGGLLVELWPGMEAWLKQKEKHNEQRISWKWMEWAELQQDSPQP